MRFCITFLLFVLAGCNTPKTDSAPLKSESIIEPTSDGIMVTKYVLSQTTSSFQDAVNAFGSSLTSKSLEKSLLTEGVLVRVIDSIDLPAVVATIGTVEDKSIVWHGQVLQWRDVVQRRVPQDGILVTESGRAHFVDRGYLSLLTRSWLLKRDNLLQIYIQLIPSWHIPKIDGIILGQGTGAEQSTLFEELRLELLLQDDEALVLFSELKEAKKSTGPALEGNAPVRLVEAILGGDVDAGKVVLLVVEANILPRE
jgi:hypothetical protein